MSAKDRAVLLGKVPIGGSSSDYNRKIDRLLYERFRISKDAFADFQLHMFVCI